MKGGRLPSLDGLRAISILMVIHSHLTITPQLAGLHYHKYVEYVISGDLGVHIFFVISGFLITTLLLTEEKEYGKISLGNFYLRRTFRIFPAYYFFLLVAFIANRYIVNDWDIKSIVTPLTYTTGLFTSNPGYTVGHTWSLAVEEQFYLLYPCLLMLVKNDGVRKKMLIAAIVLIPFLRVLIYRTLIEKLRFSILYNGDSLLWGCLLALYKDRVVAFLKNHTAKLNIFLVIILLVNIAFKYANYHWIMGFLTIPFTLTVENIMAVALLVRFTLLPSEKSVGYRFLNNPVITYIGILSYGIYLWQQFIIQPDPSPFFWKKLPYSLVTVFLLAWLSYTCIEKPFLSLRKRLADSRLKESLPAFFSK